MSQNAIANRSTASRAALDETGWSVAPQPPDGSRPLLRRHCGTTPGDVVEQCLRLRGAGVGHPVFDFRLSFPQWKEQIQMLGEEVLPRLREEDA